VNTRRHLLFSVTLGATALALVAHILLIFLATPMAQPQAGGLAQKIFYFHVPAAYAMYLCGAACFFGSAAYLASPTEGKNAVARGGAEAAVLFGVMMLISGMLWAKKAWGVYWVWDPRLTTLLLSVVIYIAVVVLRAFTGDGDAERKFAAAFGVLGTVNLPIIHYAVQKWGGNHPTVIGKGGGGLAPAMSRTLGFGFIAMTLVAIVLLWLRTRLALQVASLARVEEEVLALDPTDEDAAE
jgi:heme exporter protein C